MTELQEEGNLSEGSDYSGRAEESAGDPQPCESVQSPRGFPHLPSRCHVSSSSDLLLLLFISLSIQSTMII